MTATPLSAATVDTPVGPLRLIASKLGLRAVLWPGDDPRRVPLEAACDGLPAPALAATCRQLDEYFAGTRTVFELPLDPCGTPFQLTVWRALAGIPYGETLTYGELASRIGRPGAARAVGAANGRNPLSIVLPCHRVVGAGGDLRGFAGGLAAKRALLEHERRVAGAAGGRYARSRAPSSKQASPEDSTPFARAGRNRGT